MDADGLEREKVVFLHTPKTGGAAMAYFLYRVTQPIRRNYMLSFAGIDDSTHFHDEQSTQRETGNRCVIERAFMGHRLVRELGASPHFRQAKLLIGHTTMAFGQLFPEYRFRYLTVLREPVTRTISNLVQFTRVHAGGIRFGAYESPEPVYSPGYWAFIYKVLTAGYPIAGLLTYENIYLRDCMTHILQGSPYLDVHEPPNLHLAIVNAMRIQVSFFDDFNAGVQRSLDALGIPVSMAENTDVGAGREHVSDERARYGPHYGAPQKIVDFVADTNATDRRLYEILKARDRQT